MKTTDQKVVMMDSEEAAQYRTDIVGWVSRSGRFYGEDERIARYDGATHAVCRSDGCENVVEKTWCICRACRDKRDVERYEAMEKREWDGALPVYSEAHDGWFADEDAIADHLHDHPDMTVVDLRLVIAEEMRLSELDADYWCDDMHEDADLPSDVEEAMNRLNEVIRNTKNLSYTTSKYAAIINVTQ